MTHIFDTHAHYDDEAFDGDREKLLTSLPEQGIGRIVNVGASLDSCKRTLELMDGYDYIYGAIGIHPNETAELTKEDLEWMKRQRSHEKCVAVGEIGLDYYWDEPEWEIQKSGSWRNWIWPGRRRSLRSFTLGRQQRIQRSIPGR